MLHQVRAPGQSFAANLTLELWLCVFQLVLLECVLVAERLLARLALKLPGVQVGAHVSLQVALVGELLAADVAGEPGLPVLVHVGRQVLKALERLGAHLALDERGRCARAGAGKQVETDWDVSAKAGLAFVGH